MNVLKKRGEVGSEHQKKHAMMLELDADDDSKLREMVERTGTSKADVLRQCLRYVYGIEFGRESANVVNQGR